MIIKLTSLQNPAYKLSTVFKFNVTIRIKDQKYLCLVNCFIFHTKCCKAKKNMICDKKPLISIFSHAIRDVVEEKDFIQASPSNLVVWKKNKNNNQTMIENEQRLLLSGGSRCFNVKTPSQAEMAR